MNQASRLKGINKLFGTTIIIGKATRAAAAGRSAVRELDTIAVYGRAGGTAFYERLGDPEPGVPAEPWVTSYEAGLRLYRARRWCEAAKRFRAACGLRGRDRPSELMDARSRELAANPPDAGWRPVRSLEAK